MTYALHLKRAGLLGVPSRFKCLGCLLESAVLVFDGRAGPSQRPAAASSVKGASQRSQRCFSEAWRSFTGAFRQEKLTYSLFQQGTQKISLLQIIDSRVYLKARFGLSTQRELFANQSQPSALLDPSYNRGVTVPSYNREVIVQTVLMQLYSSEPTQSGMCDGLVPQAFQAVVILFTSHGGSLLVGPARATSLDCIFRYTITLSTVVLSTQAHLNFSEESLSSYKYFHSRGHAVGNQLGAKCNLFVSKSLFILSGTTAESLRKLEAWVISVPL